MVNVRFGSKAEILIASAGVCFDPESGHENEGF
jgi:hypothetical protein